MEAISMSGNIRTEVGGKESKNTRSEGLVPCVMYGNTDPVHFTIDKRQFRKVVYTPNVYIINLNIDGKEYKAVIKDVQFHPVSDEVLHADFFLPAPGQKFEMKIPVRLAGTSPGVLNGGKLALIYRKLRVSGSLETFPDYIDVSISKLKIGMGIRVSELSVDGITFLDAPLNYVVNIKTARGAVDVDDEEEGEAEGAAEGENAEAAAE